MSEESDLAGEQLSHLEVERFFRKLSLLYSLPEINIPVQLVSILNFVTEVKPHGSIGSIQPANTIIIKGIKSSESYFVIANETVTKEIKSMQAGVFRLYMKCCF